MTDLKHLIVETLRSNNTRGERLRDACDRVGLSPEQPSDCEEETKAKYVAARLARNRGDDWVTIATRLYNELQTRELREAILPFIPKHICHEIRERVFEELEHAQKIHGQYLHGAVDPDEFVRRVGGRAVFSFSFNQPQARVDRDILPEIENLLKETDEQFFGLLCEVVHPRVRIRHATDTSGALFQAELVKLINKHLSLAGFKLEKSGTVGADSVFAAVAIRGTPDEVRCLIFAATDEKPDLVVSDLLSGDFEVSATVHSPYLVYREPISADGLTWKHLVSWWAERTKQPADEPDTRKRLFELLRNGLQSEAEKNLFWAYCKLYPLPGGHHPALIPQFYLRWDPLTGKAVRVSGQRYDFLLLLPHRVRVILEVDGIQHYATKKDQRWDADSAQYVKTIADTRDLQLSGYEVHRFSTSELRSREDSVAVLEPFFARLYERHGIGRR